MSCLLLQGSISPSEGTSLPSQPIQQGNPIQETLMKCFALMPIPAFCSLVSSVQEEPLPSSSL